MDLRELFKDIKSYLNKDVIVEGWIKNNRDGKSFGFIDFSDGTVQDHLQIVYDDSLASFDT